MNESRHQPVLPRETLDLLAPKPGEVAVDATVGRGGHAVALAAAVAVPAEAGSGAEPGTLIAVDRDQPSLAFALERIAQEVPVGVRVEGVHASFVELPRILGERGLRADAVLADLGFSSAQMDDPERGFSFRADGPLDMRLDPSAPTTAADLVNTMAEAELARTIFTLGEDPMARAIARNVVRAREMQPIQTTAELADLVVEAYGRRARSSRMHPATRTFMALRIALNDELGALERLLEHVARGARECVEGGGATEGAGGGSGWLRSGARIAIISFHSLEDRIVKHAFAALERDGLARRLTRKPVTADAAEVEANPRARSAKLRAVCLAEPSGG